MGEKPTKVAVIFDDGFIKSTLATAKLFEEFKLPAVFGVIADSSSFVNGCGDFAMWNEMQARGHIVQPHGWRHAKLSEVSHKQAVCEIEKCFATFSEKLEGFDPKKALYAFAYNSGTPKLCEYLLPRVRAIRIGGSALLSESQLQSRVWESETFGPGDPAEHFTGMLKQARQQKPAALFYCLHGIDGEYWGAIALDKLRRILDNIVTDEQFEYWPLT